MKILIDSKTANCESMQDLAKNMEENPLTYIDINDKEGKLESKFLSVESSDPKKQNSEALILFSKEYTKYFENLEDSKPFAMSLDATFAVVPRLKGVYQLLTIMIKHESHVNKKIYNTDYTS